MLDRKAAAMATEAPTLPPSALTVWVGPVRYVFPPGRDVIVGYGGQCDIPLDRADNPAATSQTARPVVVLRFSGTHWVAIDRSPNGIFVDGNRMSTVDIRNGQAITIGDPLRGPRLILGVGPAVGPRAPKQPNKPDEYAPTQRTTQRMRIPTSQPPRVAQPTAPMPGPPGKQTSAEGNTTRRLPLQPGARTVGVAAHQLSLTADGQELLTSVSFTARPGTLTAVVGPSAERNCALLGLLAGTGEPSFGTVTVDEHDVHAEPELMRTRVGIVSHDDRAHPNLTVERALGYAAELRLPAGTSAENRGRVVEQVLDELELTPHRRTRIRKLSPEVRRCASMAIELITRPTLLVVDEPSAGLDATQEYHVMAMLRRQADFGCVVVVSMTSQTSLRYLNMCDQVVLLAPTGTVAYVGAPAQIESAVGTADWSQVIGQVSADPRGAHRAFLARKQESALTVPSVAEPVPPPAGPTTQQQIRLVARRQARLLFADRVYFLVLVVLPFALAGLTLLIPGDSGLDRAGPKSTNPHEAIEILAALNIAAVIMGIALTIGDLAGQRRVFRREQSVGLSTVAYLAGKLIVFSVVAAIQAAILVAIVVLVKGGPVHGAVLLQNPAVELYVSVAATAIVSAIIGLALSSVGSSLREAVPLAVPVILASLLFAGGLVGLVGTWVFDQISWLIPAKWGFAASGSTVDLHRVDPLAVNAQTWTHYSGWWVFDMVMLAFFGAMWAGLVLFRLRSPKQR